ncbi:hypothetical protein C8Q79DRAFT_1010554 [Trametes meyenii]|nr:hypothetical protein C8Q79DRAFT_1010554 [Trametes meyenii]
MALVVPIPSPSILSFPPSFSSPTRKAHFDGAHVDHTDRLRDSAVIISSAAPSGAYIHTSLTEPRMAGAASSPLATFQFSSIGHIPALLQRFSTPEASGQDTNRPQSPSPPPSPRAPTSTLGPSTSRKTLLEALGGIQSPYDMNSAQGTWQLTDDASRAPGSSGSASHPLAPNGEPFSAMNGKPPSPVRMNGGLPASQAVQQEASYSLPPINGSDLGTSRSTQLSISPFLPASSLSLSAPNPLSLGVVEAYTLRQDDPLDNFRNALQRLHEESAQYSRREEETRLAVARQQDQAARWHARADAVMETLTAAYAQCERRVSTASNVLAEVERLRGVVRQHEEEAAENSRQQADLKARITELEHALEEERTRVAERQRLKDACIEELRQTASQATVEKTRLEEEVRSLSERLQIAECHQAVAAAERERDLLTQLEAQKQGAAQEKQKLLEQLRGQKRDAEQRGRKLALLEEKSRIEAQHRAELEARERTLVAEERGSTSRSAVTEIPAAVVPQKRSPQPQTDTTSPAPAINGAKGQPGGLKPDPRTPFQGPKSLGASLPRGGSPLLSTHMMKSESATPVLDATQMQWSVSNREPPPETPTTKKTKPELSTIGRKPSLTLTSTSPHAALPRLPAFVKPEVFTPLVARISQAPAAGGSSTSQPPRREQSLDYVPETTARLGDTGSDISAPPSVSSGATNPLTDQLSTSVAPLTQPRGRPSSRPLPTNVISTDNAPDTPSPAVSFGTSPEFPPPHHSLPDLAYPSREGTPALIMSTLPSDDGPMGLGISNLPDEGVSEASENRLRGPTSPPPVEAGKQGRGTGGTHSRDVGHYSPAPAVATREATAWEIDHWSPTPDRPPPNRRPYSPPVRHKRTRDEDNPPVGSMPRRPRISPPNIEPSRTAVLIPRQPSGQYRRSPSPDYSPRRDDYRPAPARRPPSPSRPRSPIPSPSYGYAHQPPPSTNRPDVEAEVRSPQMAPPAVPPAPTPGSARRTRPSPRAKPHVAAGTLAYPFASAPPASRGAPQGRASPSSPPAPADFAKIPLLARMELEPDASDGNNTPVRTFGSKDTGRGGSVRGAQRGRRGAGSPTGFFCARQGFFRSRRREHLPAWWWQWGWPSFVISEPVKKLCYVVVHVPFDISFA